MNVYVCIIMCTVCIYSILYIYARIYTIEMTNSHRIISINKLIMYTIYTYIYKIYTYILQSHYIFINNLIIYGFAVFVYFEYPMIHTFIYTYIYNSTYTRTYNRNTHNILHLFSFSYNRISFSLYFLSIY